MSLSPNEILRIPGLLCDAELRRLCEEENMITPFRGSLKEDGVISSGLSSYGYDATLGYTFYRYRDGVGIIDPKHVGAGYDLEVTDNIVAPHDFVLGHTVETFTIPEDVTSICLGKSTYARCGLIVNVTPLEAGWSGQVTLEFSNTTNRPILLYPGEGICQFLFIRGAEPCEVPYNARHGKYMNQTNVTFPKIK